MMLLDADQVAIISKLLYKSLQYASALRNEKYLLYIPTPALDFDAKVHH